MRALPAPVEVPPRPDQRLGRWLRALRATLTPGQVGLVTSSRRRATSLTQVDVARLAGLTPRAYQLVEQGHRLPGPRVTAGIAHALRLTTAQVAYLHQLAVAQYVNPDVTHDLDAVRQIVHSQGLPTVAYDQTWQILAHNAAFAATLPAAARASNLLTWFFSVEAKQRFLDWHAEAAELIARLRAVQAHYRDTSPFDALIAELSHDASASALWEQGVDVASEPARKSYRVWTAGGTVAVRQVVQLQPSGTRDPSLRVAVCLPKPSKF